MSTEIRVVRRKDRFVQVPNDTIRDNRLSFRARGVLAYVLSLPDWEPRDSRSIAENGTEGRDAILKVIKELTEHGYFHKRTVRVRGRWVQQIAYCESPDLDPWEEPDPPQGSAFTTPEYKTPVRRTPADQDVKEEDRLEDLEEDLTTNTTSPPPSGARPKAKKHDVLTSDEPRWQDARCLALLLRDTWHLTFGNDETGRRKISETAVKDADKLLRLGPADIETPVAISLDRAMDVVAEVFDLLAEANRGGFCWAKVIQSPANLREHWVVLLDSIKQAKAPKPAPYVRPADQHVTAEQSNHPALRTRRPLPVWIWDVDPSDPDPLATLESSCRPYGWTAAEALASTGRTAEQLRASA